jgi:sec-independent protein translocase protein TatA
LPNIPLLNGRAGAYIPFSTGKPRGRGPDLLVCGKSQRLGIIVMGSFSLMHWVVVLFIILIIFGAGKLPRVMGDFAKGIKAFKSGMKEEEAAENQPQVTAPPATPPGAAPAGAHAGPDIRPGERA